MEKSLREPPTIVFSGDGNYAIGMGAAMQSVLTHLTGASRVNVYVLHPPTLNSSTRDRLRSVAESAPVDVDLTFVPVDEEKHLAAFDLHVMDGWTHTIFYRPLLGQLLPERHRRVLYLDCDVIVEEDVAELLATDLDGHIIGAVQERVVSCPEFGLSRWKELGLKADAPYFNSGVMLIDMERWREEQVGQRVLEYLHTYGPQLNIKGNQGGFNAVLAGKWKRLDQRWNVQNWYLDDALYERFGYEGFPPRDELSRLRTAPSIIHYTHALKPWHPGCNHPYQDRFFHYLRASGWFTSAEYVLWRGKLRVQDAVLSLKEASRPLRHKIGLQRSSVPT